MLSTDRWIKKKWYLHTMEYYSAVEKNEIMPFVTTKIDLEIVILKNVRQRQISCGIVNIWNLQKLQMNLFT